MRIYDSSSCEGKYNYFIWKGKVVNTLTEWSCSLPIALVSNPTASQQKDNEVISSSSHRLWHCPTFMVYIPPLHPYNQRPESSPAIKKVKGSRPTTLARITNGPHSFQILKVVSSTSSSIVSVKEYTNSLPPTVPKAFPNPPLQSPNRQPCLPTPGLAPESPPPPPIQTTPVTPEMQAPSSPETPAITIKTRIQLRPGAATGVGVWQAPRSSIFTTPAVHVTIGGAAGVLMVVFRGTEGYRCARFWAWGGRERAVLGADKCGGYLRMSFLWLKLSSRVCRFQRP